MSDCNRQTYTHPDGKSVPFDHAASLADTQRHSFERRLFEVVLSRAGPALGGLLEPLMVIFVANVKVEKDVEQRAR